MSASPYPAPARCTDPARGADATQALGRTSPPHVAAHLQTCPACRLQRAAFDRLDAHALPPTRSLLLATRRRVLGATSSHRR